MPQQEGLGWQVLDLLGAGLVGLVHVLEPQGLGTFRSPTLLLQTRGLYVRPWEGEGGMRCASTALGRGSALCPFFSILYMKGGLAGRCCSRWGWVSFGLSTLGALVASSRAF